MNQQNKNRKKKFRNFPAVTLLGLLITCIVVIAAVVGNSVVNRGGE